MDKSTFHLEKINFHESNLKPDMNHTPKPPLIPPSPFTFSDDEKIDKKETNIFLRKKKL